MANSPQAKKRIRQSTKRRLLNASQRSAMRTKIKKLLKLLKEKSLDQAKLAFQEAVKSIDTLAGKNTVDKNKASRIKSRLNKRLKKAASA